METLFAFDNRNYQDCQAAYRGTKNQEYYLGDYSIESGSVVDVRADRKAVGTCSIIRACSSAAPGRTSVRTPPMWRCSGSSSAGA
jgi:hypothetical protein